MTLRHLRCRLQHLLGIPFLLVELRRPTDEEIQDAIRSIEEFRDRTGSEGELEIATLHSLKPSREDALVCRILTRSMDLYLSWHNLGE